MPQYRDLTQGWSKTFSRLSNSKKRQALIDAEKKSYKTPSICEFCEGTYNESKTDECHLCECMREGRAYATMPTLRESIKDTKQSLRDVGLSERD